MKNKEAIKRALNLTDQQYADYVQDIAFEWLRMYFNSSKNMMDRVSHGKMFWKWWLNQWDIREERFCLETNILRISEEFTEKETKLLRTLYAEAHAPRRMVARPNVFVVTEIKNALRHLTNMELLTIKRSKQ